MDIIELIDFYKAIVIQPDVFESQIVDEKHFSTVEQAQAFKECMMNRNNGLVCILCQM